MVIYKVYRYLMLFGGVLCSANLAAQQKDSTFVDIDYVIASNTWSISNNPIGLKYYPLQKISRAKAYFDKANGSFKNYQQSDDSYKYGIDAQSIFRLSSKTMVSGNIAYHSFKGENMGGSAFIDPYKSPFDIVERVDTDKGIKNQESYNLGTSISSEVTRKLTIGGAIGYNAGNFAKAKDLRHVNKLLDMELSFGGSYLFTPSIGLGMNYEYKRRIESISFNTYGNKTEVPYSSLISFGAFYGKLETFTDNGYTAAGNTTPLTNNTQGGAIQLNVRLNSKVNWFNEFVYNRFKGAFVGKGSTAFTSTTNHSGNNYGFKTRLEKTGNNIKHIATMRVGYFSLINVENEDFSQTNSSGVRVVLYYIQKERLDKQELKANLAYTLFKDIQQNNPIWTFDVNADYFRRQQTATVYPFYRDQTIDSYQINANLKRNIIKSDHMYSVALGLGYGAGGGLVKYDGLYGASSTETPINMDLYLYQEFEYFTKPRVMADISLQYTKKIKQNIAPYAKLTYNYTKAFDTQFLGGNFGVAGASVGCNF